MHKLQAKAKKTYKPLLALSLLAVLAISSTTAYFTGTHVSDDNVFTSGDLKVEVVQDEVLNASNWIPGDEHTLEFSMKNTGTMSEYVKGYLGGEWNESNLGVENTFRIAKLERKVNGEWVVVDSDGLELNEDFYLSAGGTETGLIELGSGESEEFRMSIKLDENIGDEYQDEYFTAQLHLAGKQVVDGASWPSSY